MVSILGILLVIGGCIFFSRDRKLISWQTVIGGLGLQALLAFVILHTKTGHNLFSSLGEGVKHLISFADYGGSFTFGALYDSFEFIFFFRLTAAVVFICALISLLYQLGILQPILQIFSLILGKILGVSGPEILVNTGSALVGQIESALPLKPYLKNLSNSQFFAIMTGGMSTISMVLLAVYADLGIRSEYLLAANLMGIPGGLLIAKTLYPSPLEERKQLLPEASTQKAHNAVDAIVRGASEGFKISMAIVAVVIAFVSIIAVADSLIRLSGISLADILSYVFYPFAWLTGADHEEVFLLSSLIGKKIIFNEFIAYNDLLQKVSFCPGISQKTIMLSTFALCGFGNLGSIGIQIGAFSQMLPERQKDFASLAGPSMIAGSLASCLSTFWASLFYVDGMP